MVKPDEVDETQTIHIAREIVKKIESELDYPGQIKVNVIRETRAIEYAKQYIVFDIFYYYYNIIILRDIKAGLLNRTI